MNLVCSLWEGEVVFYFGLSITVDNDVLGGLHGDLRWVLLVTYKKWKLCWLLLLSCSI